MSALLITWRDVSGLQRFDNMLKSLGPKEMTRIGVRGINHTGDKAKTQVIRALTKQTGLKRKVIVKAIKVSRASWGDTNYVMLTRGGDIALKYFSARETRRGVSASPFGQRKTFPHTFMRAGWWPDRVTKSNWNGQVFLRTGGSTGSGQDEFEKVKSGVYIPREMVEGETRQAFEMVVRRDLPLRIEHEIRRATNGAMS
jgi:hypothetical protein